MTNGEPRDSGGQGAMLAVVVVLVVVVLLVVFFLFGGMGGTGNDTGPDFEADIQIEDARGN
jgi:hypothetical protein